MLRRAGHILGAASLELEWERTSVDFSGDLRRHDDPIMLEAEPLARGDYLVVESTYGDRLHPKIDPQRTIQDIVGTTTKRGGTVVIPAFAVGRVQALLYYFERIKLAGGLGNVPIFLDSPMAVDASEIFCEFKADHKLPYDECKRACNVATYIRSIEDSKRLTESPVPKVVISANQKNTVLFAGYQAEGTRGAAMMSVPEPFGSTVRTSRLPRRFAISTPYLLTPTLTKSSNGSGADGSRRSALSSPTASRGPHALCRAKSQRNWVGPVLCA